MNEHTWWLYDWLFIVVFFHLFSGNPKTGTALQNCPKLGWGDQTFTSLHQPYQSSDGGSPGKAGAWAGPLSSRGNNPPKGDSWKISVYSAPSSGANNTPSRGIWAAHHNVPYGYFKIHKVTSEVIARGTLFPQLKKNKGEGRSSAPMWLLITHHILS